MHQDVKPKNIMLDESGRPRLIDFGMARWRHAWSGSRAGPSGGTLAFMAPEQARVEAKRIGAPSDIFGLGGVLYFLLTGKTPFGGGTRQEQWQRASQCDFDRDAMRAKGVPRRLERIVLKAMATEPGDRYASADRDGRRARRPRPAPSTTRPGGRGLATGGAGRDRLVVVAAADRAIGPECRGRARTASRSNSQHPREA